jgi:ABC-type arginine/histidine transport system permease subunit
VNTVRAQNHQASVVFVFYLGNSVALTQVIQMWIALLLPNCYIQYMVTPLVCQPLFLIKLGVDNSLESLYTVHS